jgi:hypothetical protein
VEVENAAGKKTQFMNRKSLATLLINLLLLFWDIENILKPAE